MDISQSLDRILQSQESFGDAFYDVFLNTHPEVHEFFRGVDMQRQGVLLTMALTVVEHYSRNGYPATKKYLQYLGSKHHERSIPKELYSKWSDALLETLAEFHGSDWSDALAMEWREAVRSATELMFEGYSQKSQI